MSFSRLLVTLSLMMMMSISNEPFALAHKEEYKIYGFPYSASTWRVLAVLHEKGLSYYPITVNLRTGEQKKPSFLSINPFGQVPVLLDGHLKLTVILIDIYFPQNPEPYHYTSRILIDQEAQNS
ncbi:BnaC05g01560D [Brassica napus]|uniref:glutathione transferase n=1 Tax=Brassica napus TaxID=3708 RepID=A0A078G0J7_BRANA|nr:BnaC05g01560D [Brassica napus]